MAEKLLSAQQVSEFLGMHVKTLYRLVRDNRIALNFVRLPGRAIAFRPSAVQTYIDTHEVTRDGAGKKRKKSTKPAILKRYQMMTPAEAAAFLEQFSVKIGGVSTILDGEKDRDGDDLIAPE